MAGVEAVFLARLVYGEATSEPNPSWNDARRSAFLLGTVAWLGLILLAVPLVWVNATVPSCDVSTGIARSG